MACAWPLPAAGHCHHLPSTQTMRPMGCHPVQTSLTAPLDSGSTVPLRSSTAPARQ
jgi:hypothetical protein